MSGKEIIKMAQKVSDKLPHGLFDMYRQAWKEHRHDEEKLKNMIRPIRMRMVM
jgi:hypothetical protein